MDYLREKIKKFVDKKPLAAFFFFVLLLGIYFGIAMWLNQDYTAEEYAAAKKKILSTINDETLCSDLYDEVYYKIDFSSEEAYAALESVEELNENEYTLFLLYDFYQMVKEDGLGGYLYTTDYMFASEIEGLLLNVGLVDLAAAYHEFLETEIIKKEDFAADIEEHESLYLHIRIDELYDLYPSMSTFDENFEKNVKNGEFIERLALYARVNIDAYEYYAISEQQLEMELHRGL